MRDFVVALLWLGPISMLLYMADVDVRHVLMEVPDYLRHLITMFFQ